MRKHATRKQRKRLMNHMMQVVFYSRASARKAIAYLQKYEPKRLRKACRNNGVHNK